MKQSPEERMLLADAELAASMIDKVARQEIRDMAARGGGLVTVYYVEADLETEHFAGTVPEAVAVQWLGAGLSATNWHHRLNEYLTHVAP